MTIKVESLPECSQSTKNSSEKITWKLADEVSINKYLSNTDKLLSKVDIPVDTICCSILGVRTLPTVLGLYNSIKILLKIYLTQVIIC